jgi:transposase
VTKVELYEVIRRAWHVGGKSLRAISREQGVHRRVVRQALRSAIPPPRKAPEREPAVLTRALRAVIDQWLQAEQAAPRKQRHTAHRAYLRLVHEHGFAGGESTVRRYVGQRRRELGLKGEAYIPRDHQPGEEAEVDWYEAAVEFPSGRQSVQVFQMRACFSGREFHFAFPHQTQQAFLEGHVAAFGYFGGVFGVIRYDNLSAAVRKVLRGRRREETERFVLLRSHYLFTAEFCQPGVRGAHEKGGVEGAGGRFRRTHLVPVPAVSGFAELNAWLLACCAADDQRRVAGRERPVAQDWALEQPQLHPLPTTPLATAEVSPGHVDSKGRVRIRTNWYSVPIRLAHRRVEIRVHARQSEVVHNGQAVAIHERSYGRHGERLELDHYLELLRYKPGALPRSRPLRQARERGQWPPEYDRLWAALKGCYGEAEGTRQLVEVVRLHRVVDAKDLRLAIGLALEYGCCDPGAVRLLVRQLTATEARPAPLTELGPLSRFERPVADLASYDSLLSRQEEH